MRTLRCLSLEFGPEDATDCLEQDASQTVVMLVVDQSSTVIAQPPSKSKCPA